MVEDPAGAMGRDHRLYASKWLTLVLCECVMLSSGTLYTFPIFSPALKRELALTQEEVNSVGSAAHFGAFFSVLGGLFFDAYGPRATLALGGALKLGGLSMMAGVITGSLPRSRALAAACGYVFGTGCSTSLTACLGANYATFRDRAVHGRLVGLLLSFFGLSSGVFSLIYDVFFSDPTSFVRFLALFAGGVDLLASRLVGHPKHLALPGDAIELRSKVSGVVPRRGAWAARVASFFQDARAETKLGRGLAACAAIAAHVAVAAAFVGATGASSGAAFACLLALVLLFAAQFGTLLGGSGRLVFRRADMENVDATRSGEAEDVGDSEASRGGGASAARQHLGPAEMVATLDFWLVFASFFLALGSGVTVINNLSQMVSAYPSIPDPSATSRGLLKLLACANTLGRLAAGALSDRLAGKVGRVPFTAACIAGMAAGFLALFALGGGDGDGDKASGGAHVAFGLFPPLFGLAVGTIIVGAFFGALFWAMPLLTMELFGSRHFGANRGVLGLSPAIGGYAMSTALAGRVYAANAGSDNECDRGGACYRLAWVADVVACAVACAACVWLAKRRGQWRW